MSVPVTTQWQQIIGHDWAVNVLSNDLHFERVGHAYLITGPHQIGKTTLARTFAQALNCLESAEQRPCGQCRLCTLIAKDRHPDVRLIEPEISSRGKASIKIDAIRQLQRSLNLSAVEARTKVAIIKQFDAANLNAANAFLKTLEEPPRNVVLLLTASEADALLETIRSRCRSLNLRPLSTPVIENALLHQWRIDPEQAHLLAHLADGRLGWAVQASQQPELLETRQTQLAQLHEALAGSRVGRFALADKLARKPETLPPLLQTWLSWWRDGLLLAHAGGRPFSLSNIDEQERLHALVAQVGDEKVLDSLQQTSQALWQLSRNGHTRLVLENLFLSYPRFGETSS